MNIIRNQVAARPETRAVGSELDRLLREESLELPDLPGSAARIAALSGSPPARARGLTEIVAAEPYLLPRLLEVGKLAAAEPQVRIEGLADVVDWIGPAEAGDIAFTASLQAALLGDQAASSQALRQWRLCIAAALWARETATLARRRTRWTYLCGLLHDIGKPAAAVAVERIAAGLGTYLDEPATLHLVSEYQGPVARRLAQRWQLPEPVARCLQRWHDGCRSGEDDHELPAVYLGRQLADLVAGQGPEFAREALADDPVLEVLNIGPDRFRALVERAGWVTAQAAAY